MGNVIRFIMDNTFIIHNFLKFNMLHFLKIVSNCHIGDHVAVLSIWNQREYHIVLNISSIFCGRYCLHQVMLRDMLLPFFESSFFFSLSRELNVTYKVRTSLKYEYKDNDLYHCIASGWLGFITKSVFSCRYNIHSLVDHFHERGLYRSLFLRY